MTLLIVLGVLVLLLSQAQADEASLSAELGADPLLSSEQASQPDDAATQEAKNNDLLAERQALIDRWSHSITKGPGWLRTVVRYDRSEGDYGLLPGGAPIPEDFIFETWYQLDESGAVKAMVNIMWDLDGQMVQFATYRDGIWRDFGFGSLSQGEPPRLYWAHTFVPNQISLISRDQLNQAGKQTEVFTTRETFAPVQLDDMDGAIVRGSLIREMFDTNTGQILQIETVILLADGTEHVLDQLAYQAVEKVTIPPQEITDLLNQEITETQETKQ